MSEVIHGLTLEPKKRCNNFYLILNVLNYDQQYKPERGCQRAWHGNQTNDVKEQKNTLFFLC